MRDSIGEPHDDGRPVVSDELDHESEEQLIAYDEALRLGGPAGTWDRSSDASTHGDDLSGDLACIEMMHRAWRRPRHQGSALGLNSTVLPTRFIADTSAGYGTWQRLGRFEIERELGRGGCGIVFLAFDPALGRKVALKIPRPEALAVSSLRHRFLREAAAAARLDHVNIIAVYEVGEEAGVCYIASAYSPGQTLAEWLAQRGPLAPLEAATIVAALADGIEHAHSRGILHRDLKPSNVLIETNALNNAVIAGQRSPTRSSSATAEADPTAKTTWVIPKITDFGLAKILEQVNDITNETRTGAILGTPAYMSPEQATAQHDRVSARTDVYALGGILYELLTGRSPCQGENDADTIRRVVFEEPTRPGAQRSGLSRDLEAICLKCLEKQPDKRFTSAKDLATDLRRYLNGEPTLARPAAWHERVRKWARRRPAAAALFAVCCLSVLAGLAGAVVHESRLRDEVQRTANALERSQQSEQRSQELLYSADMQLASQASANRDAGRAKEILAAQIPGMGEVDRREFAWRAISNNLNRHTGQLPQHPAAVYALAYSPDGKHLATACQDGATRIWEVATRKLVVKLGDHDGEVNVVGYSPDGLRLATGDDAGKVLIRRVADWRIEHSLEHNEPGDVSPILGLAFASDGKRLFTGAGGKLTSWDLISGRQLATAKISDLAMDTCSLSPDGKQILVVCSAISRWSTDDFSSLGEVHATSGGYFSAGCFLPNGTRFVAADTTGWRGILDFEEAAHSQPLPANRGRKTTAFEISADGRFLLSSGLTRTIDVFEMNSWQHCATLTGHADRVWDLKRSPDEKSFASAGGDGEVYFWDMPQPGQRWSEAGFQMLADGAPITALAYSPDGRTMAWARSKMVELRDRQSGELLYLGTHGGAVVQLAFTSDSRRLTACTSGDEIYNWNVRTGQCQTVTLPGRALSMALLPNERLAVATSNPTEGATLSLIDWAEKRFEQKIVLKEQVTALSYIPGTDQLLVADPSGLSFRNSQTLAIVGKHPIPPGESIRHIELLPDGQRMLTAEASVTIRDVQTGALLKRLSGHPSPVIAMAAHPNGRNLASVCHNGTTCLWDLVTDQAVTTFTEVSAIPDTLKFSPEGSELAVAHDPGHSVSLLDGRELDSLSQAKVDSRPAEPRFTWPREYCRRRTVSRAVPDGVTSLAWSADSQRLMAGTLAGVYQLDLADDLHIQRRFPAITGKVTLVAAVPNCENWLTIEETGKVYQWDAGDQIAHQFEIAPNHGTPYEDSTCGKILYQLEAAAIVVDAQSGAKLWQYDSPHSFSAYSWAGPGVVALANKQGTIQFLEAERGALVAESALTKGNYYQFVTAPRVGGRLLAGRAKGGLDLFDIASGQLQDTLPINCLQINWIDTNRILLFQGKTFDDFEINKQKVNARFDGLMADFASVSPDGEKLAIASNRVVHVVWINPQ